MNKPWIPCPTRSRSWRSQSQRNRMRASGSAWRSAVSNSGVSERMKRMRKAREVLALGVPVGAGDCRRQAEAGQQQG